ncbi:hypothetical protein D9M70_649580 [compost metagenome]
MIGGAGTIRERFGHDRIDLIRRPLIRFGIGAFFDFVAAIPLGGVIRNARGEAYHFIFAE